MRTSEKSSGDDRDPARRNWRASALVALLALVASGAGLFNDFVYDDLPLIRDNDRVHSLGRLVEIVTHPYWPPPFVEQLYRPLPVALFAFEYALGAGSPMVFRVVSYLLYATTAIAVLALARRLLPERAAIAAAAIFAVHPVHVEAVALGVNQAELLVGLFAAMMVVRYIDRRRAGGLDGRDWAMLCALYAASMLSKESGFVLILLPLVAECFLFDDRPRRARAKSLWPGYAAMTAIAGAVVALRSFVLGGQPIAVVTTKMLAGFGLGDRMLTMLQVVPIWFRLFSWPQHLEADYALGGIRQPGFGAREMVGVAILVVAAWAIYAARRAAPAISFGLAWCAVGLLPVTNIVPTGILLAERTLFLPSIGFVIAAGGLGETIVARWPAARVRRGLLVACLVLVGLGIARSVARHGAWNSAHLKIVPRPPIAPRERLE